MSRCFNIKYLAVHGESPSDGLKRRVYTIGHSNRSLDDFLELLRRMEIEIVYDVRSFPTSRIAPHFAKQALSKTLRELGLKYIWDKRLGGYRKFGRDVEDVGIASCFKSEGFRAYATYLITNSDAKQACRELVKTAEHGVTAIMCSEKIPWRCHRKIISDFMTAKGFQVIHIIDKKWTAVHKLSRCAKVIDGELVYL